MLAERESMYAYTFQGRGYYVGAKLGFLKVTVEMAAPAGLATRVSRLSDRGSGAGEEQGLNTLLLP